MSLLFSRNPLVVNPELAVRIGLNEAILLQQLNYWLKEPSSGIDHDGFHWVYNTLEGWKKQFPFMSESTIKRGFTSLKRMGIVRIEQLSQNKHDKTNYYSIIHESPYLSDEVKLTSSSRSTCTDGAAQRDCVEQVNLTSSSRPTCTDVTETTTEITTDINPTHNAREGDQIVPLKPVPEYPGQPGVFFPAAELLGKFPMSKAWEPSQDFRQRANLWGRPIPAHLTPDELRSAQACFIDYWLSEGKVFNQTQWEQKFALHLQNVKPPRGNTHAELDRYPPTYNAAQRKMLDARRAQLRERGQSVEILDLDDGNLFQPVAGQKRLGPVGPMDCADYEFDQRPDDEHL
ncbi:TPA: DnaT-like ssDNA-binding domain-containing protein [Klebsiella aerogenes]